VYDPQHGTLLATLPIYARWTGNSAYTYAEVSTGLGKASWLEKIGATGKPTWRIRLGVVTGGGPILAYQTLFTPSNRYHPGLIAIRARDGKVLWGADLGPQLSLAGANHLIFALHRQSGRIDILRSDSGRELRYLQTPGYGSTGSGVMIVAGGALFVVSGTRIEAFER
jgi:hypothetical protein